jgi:hypothetical protein
MHLGRDRWPSVAVALTLLTSGIAACGDEPEALPDAAITVGNLLKVHDALLKTTPYSEKTVSHLSIGRESCVHGGVTLDMSWIVPASVPDTGAEADVAAPSPSQSPTASELAVEKIRKTMFEALKSLDPAYDGQQDSSVLSIDVEVVGGHQATHVLDNAKEVVLSAVVVNLDTPCYRFDKTFKRAGALDPLITLAALHTGQVMPSEGWSTDGTKRNTGPLAPMDAIDIVDDRLRWTWSALRTGTVEISQSQADRWNKSGFQRDWGPNPYGGVVRTLDKIGCRVPGLQRIVATASLIVYHGNITDSTLVDAWRTVPNAPWKEGFGAINDETVLPGATQPQVDVPDGPPVLISNLDPGGGVLLRGTPDKTVVQVISPCAKLDTDRVAAHAFGVPVVT